MYAAGFGNSDDISFRHSGKAYPRKQGEQKEDDYGD
jgi:hypothetical protein